MSDGAEPGERPLLTVDMDGVICRPILGWNAGIHRRVLDPAAPATPARVYPRPVHAAIDYLRFNFRTPMPGALEAARELARLRRLVLLTGRRTMPAAWLARHGLEALFDDVMVNDTGLRSPHFKLQAVERLGAAEHVDDDPRTAQLLAQASAVRVFLCDWPRSRGVPLDARVERVGDLADLARRLAGEASGHLDRERTRE